MTMLMGPIEAGFRSRIVETRARMAGPAELRARIIELEVEVRGLRSELRDRDEHIARLSAIPRHPSRRIIDEVCDKHEVTPASIRSPRRDREIAAARHECCYRLRHELEMSLPAIGRLLGDRDHTTVLNSINQFAKTLEANREVE